MQNPVGVFLERVQNLPQGPGVSLDEALQPALEFEADLRKLFANEREDTRLADPHVGLVDVFNAPDAIRTTRARVIQGPEDLASQHVMPLVENDRRKEGAPCMVPDVEEFRKNWAIFTEGSLSQLLDWNNVVAAGGSVLACLAPLSEAAKKSKRSIRKFYHNTAYPTSDVDLFLWGLDPEQAEAKIKTIFEAVRDSVPWDVTCVRTKHTVSIHSQYPYRSVQIVLRLYQSPAEILAGFDIDAPCCAYDGEHVWANPRSIVSMMRQCNTVDMTRRSPSYEVRLAKYSSRGYEVYVPNLKRVEIDPTIYERSIAKMEGLARLLVLEKLTDTDTRYAFLESRRTLRGRPNPLGRGRNKKKLKGDLKADTSIGGLEQNDYDVESLHIPYGPGWDARRIDKLVYQTDLGMNSTFNPKNKGRRLHRHPAFFGTVEECLADCCEACPEPIDDDERKVQTDEDEKYIRGRIKFIEENPGRQSITGSFNPIDIGEWSEQVYLKPTQQLFSAIAMHDRETVKLLIKDLDVNQRDHVGRTCLHVAIMCKAADIACDLVNAGARITARLVDGKTPLHLASQYDQVAIIRKLFEKNAQNVEEDKVKNPKQDEEGTKDKDGKKSGPERPSSEDDWSSHGDEDIDMVEAEGGDDGDDDDDKDDDDVSGEDDDADDDEGKDDEDGDIDDNDTEGSHPTPERSPTPDGPPGDIPEDESNEPDIININLLDWDFGFTALAYAILYGAPETIEILLVNGADVTFATKPATYGSSPLHPLTLTIVREDEDEACKIAERLITAGATSSTATDQMWTIFHSAVSSGRAKLVNTILRCDKHASSVLNFPCIGYSDFTFPVVTTIHKGNYAVLAALLSSDAKLALDEADITRAQDACSSKKRIHASDKIKDYTQLAYQPLETALQNYDDVVQLLLALGTPFNIGLKRGLYEYSSEDERGTIADWVNIAGKSILKKLSVAEKSRKALNVKAKALPKKHTWKQFFENYRNTHTDMKSKERRRKELEDTLADLNDTKTYLDEVKRLLTARGAKSWKEVYPGVEGHLNVDEDDDDDMEDDTGSKLRYVFIPESYSRRNVPGHLTKSYDELFAACYAGDDKKVEKLCLPATGGSKGAASPLNISVFIPSDSSSWGQAEGYTPLFAAISGRRWSTVKLILAIVAAQYHPEDPKAKKFSKTIKLDDDDDEEEDDEDMSDDDSDGTAEQDEAKFVDIAARSSNVQCEISPRKFLEVPSGWSKDKESGKEPLITIAVINNDLETFVQIANLYQALPEPALEKGLEATIVAHDCPEILDEFIRRTGLGVEIKGAQAGDDPHGSATAVNDTNRVYLGLNVHGKKRKDLATKNDPNAQSTHHAHAPILWLAAKAKAKGVIEYLAGDRPLAAYRHYASSHSDEQAILLRRTSDLDKILPTWLGWSINELGESPLSAAIIGKDLSIVQLLLKKLPELMVSALKQRIKFVGYNLLTLAARTKAGKELVDFLLSRSLDAAEQDLTRGWNIYHHICELNDGDLLEHLLQKLPRDINEALLIQESKARLNTPLHIAVKSGHKHLVKLIIDYNVESALIRDIDGQTALHAAVKKSFVETTELLLAKVDNKALQMEDGVGNTVPDIASLVELGHRMSNYSEEIKSGPDELSPNSVDVKKRYDEERIKQLEEEIPRLHAIVATILPEEKRKRRTKIVWEVNTFIALLESRVKDAKAKLESAAKNKLVEDDDLDLKNPTESGDSQKTLLVVREALKVSALQRQLIHVSHVQRSIGAGLENVKIRGDDDEDGEYRAKKDELEEEEDKDKLARERSMVFEVIDIKADEY